MCYGEDVIGFQQNFGHPELIIFGCSWNSSENQPEIKKARNYHV